MAAEREARYERIAKEFHQAYEELAPIFGYRTREESAKPWKDVPRQNQLLMIATVKALIEEDIIRFNDAAPGDPGDTERGALTRSNLARAQGLAESIAKARPYSINIDGFQDVAAEIVALIESALVTSTATGEPRRSVETGEKKPNTTTPGDPGDADVRRLCTCGHEEIQHEGTRNFSTACCAEVDGSPCSCVIFIAELGDAEREASDEQVERVLRNISAEDQRIGLVGYRLTDDQVRELARSILRAARVEAGPEQCRDRTDEAGER